MSEYIEREAVQKIICGWCGVCENPTLNDLMRCDDICPQFAALPAADVWPVVKATWVVKEMEALFSGMDEHPVFACSECGYQIYDLLDNVKERHHYCPNCGARMEEAKDG